MKIIQIYRKIYLNSNKMKIYICDFGFGLGFFYVHLILFILPFVSCDEFMCEYLNSNMFNANDDYVH